MRGIIRSENPDCLEATNSKVFREAMTEIVREIGHLVERVDTLLIDPIRDLFGAVRTLVLRGQISRDLFEKKRLNRWFAGLLHDRGYARRTIHSKRRTCVSSRVAQTARDLTMEIPNPKHQIPRKSQGFNSQSS